MFEFICIQYQMHRLTDDQVRAFAPRWITAEQVNAIIGGAP